MKKLFLILIMGISTCITAYFIMIWKPLDNGIVQRQINSNDVKKVNSEINETSKVEKYSNDREKTYYENGKENSKEEINNLSNEEDMNLDMAVQNNISHIDIKEIEYSLSKVERDKVDRIIKSLSSVDLINIKEKFSKEDKVDGFREGFNLIRRRLSDKDYEEIKVILSEYIDFTILEVEI